MITVYMASRPLNYRTLVLFQFHDHFDLCGPRIQLLRRCNPSTPIFGLFCGQASDLDRAQALTADGLDHVDHDPSHPPPWFKRHTDLAVASWFRRVGHVQSFDRLYVVQWDLASFAPLQQLYAHVPDDAVALTGVVPLAQIADRWDWTAHPPLAAESARLLADARHRYGYTGEPLACIGPGYSLPRDFLAQFAALDCEFGHDELRLPLMAQIFGVSIVDTGFYPEWFNPEVEAVFNADGREVDPERIVLELSKPHGRRVFHPCRARFDAALMAKLAAAAGC